MATENRLGRGLDALFGGAQVAAPAQPSNPQDIRELPIEKILPNPEQARKQFDADKLADLAASIKEQGILQPLLVAPADKGQYRLVAGERRWRAAKLAGLKSLPIAIISKTEIDRLVISLIENLQREDLNPMEEASGIHALMERCGLTQEQAAQRLGKSRSAVANALRLRGLPPTAQEDLLAGRITAGHARGILSLAKPELQEALREHIIADDLTVRQVEEAVSFNKEHGLFPWEAETEVAQTEGEGKSNSPAKSPKTRDAVLVAAAKRIADALNCKAKISGDTNKGKITLSYFNTETLEDLLATLGAGGIDKTD